MKQFHDLIVIIMSAKYSLETFLSTILTVIKGTSETVSNTLILHGLSF